MPEPSLDHSIRPKLDFSATALKTAGSCSIIFGDVATQFRSDETLIRAMTEYDCSRMLCDLRHVDAKFPTSVDILITHGPKFRYERIGELAAIITVPPLTNSVEKILYAAYPLTEVARQAQGAATLHAAGVALGGKGILLLGKEGSGKTSVAIHLCRHQGFSLLGNDLVMVRHRGTRLHIVGGSKYWHLRRTSVLRSTPELLHYLPPNTRDDWSNKRIVSAAELGSKVCHRPVLLTQAVLVHVDETQKDLFIEKRPDDLVTKLILFENASRYIRATAIPGLGVHNTFDFYLPSHDNEILHSKRISLIRKLLGMPIVYVAGRSADIAAYLHERASD